MRCTRSPACVCISIFRSLVRGSVIADVIRLKEQRMLDIQWNEWGTEKSLPSLDRFVATGGDVNAVVGSCPGRNLLWLAAEQMDIPLIRRLGDLGADPNLVLPPTAVTAMHNAVDIDIDSVVQRQKHANVDELIQMITFSVTRAMVLIGGSIHNTDNKGKTPHCRAIRLHPDLGTKLLATIDG